MQKSIVFFGGLSSAEQHNILNIIPFSVRELPASVFLLPKQVIYEIDKLLKGFLLCQGDLTKGKAKVSWDVVCEPKDQGGFGLTNLGVSNEVLMIKHQWNVAAKKDTIGNGKSVNVWHDRWCPVSPLSDFIETINVYDARLSTNCTVSEIIYEGRWLWPEEWSNDFEELRQIQIPSLNDEK
ncbi:hypothetical protein Tco_1138534 [Tanacetum coccineum]